MRPSNNSKAVVVAQLQPARALLAIASVLILTAIVLLQVFLHVLSLLSYSLFIVILIIMTLTTTAGGDSPYGLLSVITFGLGVRLVYFAYTHFAVLPWGDTYLQYAEFILLMGNSLSPQTSGTNSFVLRGVSLYSGWPSLQVFSAMTAKLTGLSPFELTLAFPLVRKKSLG